MSMDMMGGRAFQLSPKLIAPRGAEPTGDVFHENGEHKIIYKRRVFDLYETLSTRRPKIGPDGKPLVRRNNNTGEILITIHEVEPRYRQQRFILRAFGNGTVKIIENFELTPEQRADRERRERRERWMDEFRDIAIEEGITPADVVKAFVAGKAGRGEEIVMSEGDAREIAHVLDDELGGVMARPEAPFPIAEMSVREVKEALKEVELTDAQRQLLIEAEEGREEPRTSVLQLLT